MKKCFMLLFAVVAGLMLIAASAPHGNGKMQALKNSDLSVQTTNVTPLSTVKPDLNFGKFPLYFITNKGQVNQTAAFYAKASRYTLWLTKEGLVFDSFKKTDVKGKARHSHSTVRPRLQRDVSRLSFLNARKNLDMVPMDVAALRVNFFKGKDKSKWQGNVPTSMAVLYKNLYKGIDLKVYGIEKQIEYDWVVKAGGNPEDIRFEYKNVKGTRLDGDGNLLVETGFGELMHKRPVSYQETAAGRISVDVRFKKTGKNTYGFSVGAYDRQYELVIDPVVLPYSSYLGGGNIDKGWGVAVDGSGYVYVTGETWSTDYPTSNQYQTNQGDIDVFVTKIDPGQSGSSSLLYSTYFGGSGEDFGYAIAVDSSGNAYITGTTKNDANEDFPLLNQYPGINHELMEYCAFVTKLDTTQSGASSLIYSTYLESTGTDVGRGIAADNSGNAYVTGYTSGNFPTLNQYQTLQGDYDAFVTQIDTTESGTSSLVYSTLLGGTYGDKGYAIALDSSGYVYVTGETNSSNFPTLNQFQTDQDDTDGFITKLDTSQSGSSSLIYSTYFGGSGEDAAYAIAVDGSGNAYITGTTIQDLFEEFPLQNQYPITSHETMENAAFVAKLDTTETGSSCLIYSTYWEGSGTDIGRGIAADNNGNAYVVGESSGGIPMLNEYQTYSSGQDAFVARFDTTQSGVSSLIYSTYLGGSGYDSGNGIAVDGSGDVYVAGDTASTNFPTANQYMSDPSDSNSDAFVAKLVHKYLTVSSPNGGEYWQLGKTQYITWDAHGLSANLRINIFKNDTSVGTVASGIDPDTGSYTWTVGQHTTGTVSADTGYKIKLREIGDSTNDYSDAAFTICSLAVTAPNGSESWKIGSSQTITWSAQEVPGVVKITLYKDGVFVGRVADNLTPSTGSYTWTVGQYSGGTAAAGSGYSIKIKCKETGTLIADDSDSSFTLTN